MREAGGPSGAASDSRSRAAAGRSPLALIFLTVFMNLVGFGIVIPILPLYAQRFGASPLVIGLLLGIYSAMQALFAPILGRLSDRVGRRPVLLVSLVGTAAGFLLMGLANSLPLLFLARVIDGITGGNISTAQAYIADVTPPEQRSKKMGLIGAAFGLGFIFGPALGGLMSHISLAAPFLFAAALSALNALLVYWLLPESLKEEHRGQSRKQPALRQVIRESRGGGLAAVLATYFVATTAFSLLTATYPLFASHRFGYNAAQIGYIFACLGLLSAVVQGGLLGWLVRIFHERGLTVAGAFCLAGGLFLLSTAATKDILLGATAAIALGHSFMAAPLNALASKSVGPTLQGQVLGAMQSAASLARIAGPVLGGFLLNVDALRDPVHYGATPYRWGGIIMLVALALSFLLRDPADKLSGAGHRVG